MTATKFLAIDSLGAEHTRSSARVYTHTVVVMYDYEVAVARAIASHGTKSAIDASRRNFDYDVLIATGSDPYPESNWKNVDGVVVKTVDADRQAIRVAKHIEAIEGGFEAYRGRELAKSLAWIEEAKAGGKYSKWSNAGFCGRLDLAHKLAAQYAGNGTKIEILPVVVAPPKVKKARAKVAG